MDKCHKNSTKNAEKENELNYKNSYPTQEVAYKTDYSEHSSIQQCEGDKFGHPVQHG